MNDDNEMDETLYDLGLDEIKPEKMIDRTHEILSMFNDLDFEEKMKLAAEIKMIADLVKMIEENKGTVLVKNKSGNK